MRILAYILVTALAIFLNSGCATIVKRSPDVGAQPRGLYPATRADITGTIRYCSGQMHFIWSPNVGGPKPNIIQKILWATFATIDLPISLVTDTICLPWDLTNKLQTKELQQGGPGYPPQGVGSPEP